MNWIILYFNKARIGSFELTADNMDMINEYFCMSLIQKDITGDLHYDIICYNGRIKK